MNNKKKTLILIVLFIILMIGASVLYNNLSADFEMDSLVVEEDNNTVTDDTNTDTDAAVNNNSSNTAANDSSSGENSTNKSEETNSSENTENQLTLAPDFTVYDLEGNEVNLSDFFGKPIIVNFWASWCGPCKNEMPDFQKAYETYGNDILFMMVNMTDGSRETVDSAKSFIEKSGYTFPIYFDKDESALYAYYVYSIPATYFINSDGTLAAYVRGMINEEALLEAIGLMK